MRYQVDLKLESNEELDIVKAIRTLSPDLQLKDAREMYLYLKNHGTTTIVAGIPLEVAEHIRMTFDEFSILVTVSESSLTSPLVLSPRAGEKWKWARMRTLERAI